MANKKVDTFVVADAISIKGTKNVVLVDEDGNTLLVNVEGTSDRFAKAAIQKSLFWCSLLEKADLDQYLHDTV